MSNNTFHTRKLDCFSCKIKNLHLNLLHGGYFQVRCNECLAASPQASGQEKAIQAWNDLCRIVLRATGRTSAEEILYRQF